MARPYRCERRPILFGALRNAIARIRKYTGGGRVAFLTDTLIQDGVVRNLEIIGEASKRLSTATTAQEPGIPWKQIAGMRDILAHHYFGVDMNTVWEVVAQHLPPLDVAVER